MATKSDHPKMKVDAENLRGECEACDGNNWAIPDDTYILAAVDASNTLTMSGMPLNVMVCQECGFVRLFAKRIPKLIRRE